MKIYTYDNPYKISSASYWSEIKDYPHLCVSQTLVEGMKKLYGRESFWYLDTIEGVTDEFYGPWTKHPENEIKQFLSITEQIKTVRSESIKRSMRFNQKEIHQALRFCIELGINPDNFDISKLNEEQQLYITFYSNLRDEEQWSVFDNLRNLSKEDFKDCLLQLLQKEVQKEQEYTVNNDLKGRAKREADNRLNYLEEIYQEYAKNIEERNLNGIVLHGVHQFTPLLLNFVQNLQMMGIEVIFLINYHSNFKNIFHTWDKVYRWTNKKMIPDKQDNSFVSLKNDLGKAIGGLLEGEIRDWDFLNVSFCKYDNLTTFSDEISNKFESARKNRDGIKENGSQVLARMNEQFYAPNNENINNLLQAYFPEQFGDRHFLSYPIGQFILGLYNMWDERELTIKLSNNILKECLSVNFFSIEGQPTPLQIFNKIELYFKNIDTINGFMSRLHYLIEQVRKFEVTPENESYQDLKGFSFYNVSYGELQYFEKVMHDLNEITRQLFEKNKDGYINYKEHYKSLINIITKKVSNASMVDEKEKELVESIKAQFENIEQLEIVGAIDDLKETIHFYLNRRSIEDSSNWIVRNFEQIDGGVMLSKKGKGMNNKYHFTMLSDQKMKVSINDKLSWPLTKNFFEAYQKDISDLYIVLNSFNEYGNFLRYSLFYATFYLENEIILSFIENSEGEKDTPYFLLEMLGLKAESKNIDQKSLSPFSVNNEIINEEITSNINIHDSSFKTVELQKMATCSYRFLLDHIIEENSYYQNEYQCKLYYTSILMKNVYRYICEYNKQEEYKNVVKEFNQEILKKKYFPFWKHIDFYDIETKVTEYVKEQIDKNKKFDPYYHNLRLDFLYAGIKENRFDEDSENIIKAVHGLRESNFFNRNQMKYKIIQYLDHEEKVFNEKTNPQICNYCKQREVCLHHFKVSGELND